MKNNLLISLGVSIALSTSLLAAIGGPHGNLSSGDTSATDNGQICVYCHTPHAANNNGPSPIWNKPSSPLTYYMYGATASGIAGQTMAGTSTDATPSDQTLSCLSCHDGVSAIDSVVNAPGSGRTDINGIAIGGYSVVPKVPSGQEKAVGMPTATSGTSGDLRNDHPVSITYVEGRAGLRSVNTVLTGWKGAETISDLLRNGKVQCTSCHDVHNNSWTMYRRTGNTDSNLCMGCHSK
jgi:predicted CXXCH cytochrome family protein